MTTKINEMTSEQFDKMNPNEAYNLVSSNCRYARIMTYDTWREYYEFEEEYGHHYEGMTYGEHLAKCMKDEVVLSENAKWLDSAYDKLLRMPYGDEWESTLDTYSDVYKDVYGYRPSGEIKTIVEARNLKDAREKWFKEYMKKYNC